MEMTTWDYNQEKERAAADVSNKKHADLRDMVFDERHDCHLLNQELGQVKAELAKLTAAQAWIKTSERLPPVAPGAGLDVLAVVSIRIGETIDKTVTMVLNYCPGYPDDDDQWPWSAECCGVYGNNEVIYWMPLPEAPK
jgi:hypothetical protein